jgi:multidrug efflux pump subunit AcrB
MILISLIPNLLPLIITAGVMGFAGIPLKPSTILVFSIAFGISVDDTIHFLAKYRQELISNKWRIKQAVFAALRETGVSMFYTSVVLFFGFSVFLSSNFGGTQALGGLVAVTLLMAMLANLILLPSLLISLEDTISNDKVLKEPKIEISSDKKLDNLDEVGVKKTELELLEEKNENDLTEDEEDRMYELRRLRAQKAMNKEANQLVEDGLKKADEEIAHLKSQLKPKEKKLPKGFVS